MKSFFKTMSTFAFVLTAISFFTSCSDNEVEPVVTPEAEYRTVSIGFGGEIEIGYEPLARTGEGEVENNDLYGIQVYSKPGGDEPEGEEYVWTPYAYGVFNEVEELSVNLLLGYKYKFVATMIKDGKLKCDLGYSANGYTGLGEPFYGTDGATALENKFNYSQSWKLGELGSGRSLLVDGKFYDIPNTDRYYGELENYFPEEGGEASIDMKRTSFGAKFVANGKLADSGTLEILIQGAPAMALSLTADKDDAISDIFTFSSVYGAWNNSDYEATISVTLNFWRTDGSCIPLDTHNIVFKRNTTTVVNVNIENAGNDNGIGFSVTETGTMSENPNTETTITDGKIVNTGVAPQ